MTEKQDSPAEEGCCSGKSCCRCCCCCGLWRCLVDFFKKCCGKKN